MVMIFGVGEFYCCESKYNNSFDCIVFTLLFMAFEFRPCGFICMRYYGTFGALHMHTLCIIGMCCIVVIDVN